MIALLVTLPSAISAKDSKNVIVRMPPQLKRRVSALATRRGVGMNDVVLEILERALGVPFTPSGRKGSPPGESSVVLLRMTPELKQKLQAAALERKSNMNRLVVGSLADHLGVRLEPPRSQILRRRKEPMASTNGSKNGRARSEDKVRVAIIGVGNCANSLLQGVEYYKDASPDAVRPRA